MACLLLNVKGVPPAAEADFYKFLTAGLKACSTLLRGTQSRRGILRQFFPGAIGSLDIQFVEQERRRDDRAGQWLDAVVHISIVFRGHDVFSEGSDIQIL